MISSLKNGLCLLQICCAENKFIKFFNIRTSDSEIYFKQTFKKESGLEFYYQSFRSYMDEKGVKLLTPSFPIPS